ncbi:MAG: type III-B CRISPR module-associated Cmr3 family protein [Limisphaerales bacterium]
MNTIILQPTDILFFRDGRPITGSLAGHGAAWPLPNVINAAFHAALHRSGFAKDAHSHRRGGRGVYADEAQRDRKFGSLVTAGPFPVQGGQTWFFPRPQDLQDATLRAAQLPTDSFDSVQSNLPDPLEYAVANRLPPSKEPGARTWLSKAAYERYLVGSDPALKDGEAADDADFADTEHTIGIGIDRERQVQDGESFYSAQYLRLRDAWQLGVFAAANDKQFSHERHGSDLVKALLNGGRHQIIVGGQQRICSAQRLAVPILPLPIGKRDDFNKRDGKSLVKWILLSPAVWPSIEADATHNINAHPGGWLPNWVFLDWDPEQRQTRDNQNNGRVLLRHRTGAIRRDYSGAKTRRVADTDQPIAARLVAALVPKPLVVTGWALPDEAGETEAERKGGAQSTHLAVPAGAVYYFEVGSPEEACKLAAALNWHGTQPNPTTIKNRRSTLLGEKGFGLGICGTWQFYEDVAGCPAQRP